MAQIRKVPPDWKHPREAGDYKPLRGYGMTFEFVQQDWADNGMTFTRDLWWGTYVEGRDCTHFQVYEEWTEGSPVSPIFATEAEAQAFITGGGVVRTMNQLHRQERPALAALSDDFERWLKSDRSTPPNPASAALFRAASEESKRAADATRSQIQ